jgi:Cd2+/Zn2+-exporting ATPase
MDRLGIQTGDDSEDESVIHVAAGGKYAGRLLLSDTLKEDASGAVFQLQSLGIKRIVLLTGDREYAARKTAGALGIEEYRSECLPEDKALVLEKIIKEKQNKEPGAYVGDGINEAPVLALADIGISMGTTGAVSAIEASDLVIMNDAVSKIPDAVCIARRTEAIVKQNILFALSAKLLILLLGLFGLSPLWLAVIAEIGVSIIATANAVRTRNTL